MGCEVGVVALENLLVAADSDGCPFHMAGAGVAANEVTELGFGGHLCGVRQTQPPFNILRRSQGLIEGDGEIAVDSRRSHMGNEGIENRVAHVTLQHSIRLSGTVEKAAPADHHWRTIETRGNHLETVRFENVIVVHECDVSTGGRIEAGVPGRRRAPICCPSHQSDPPVIGKICSLRPVVVDDYAFEVRDGLRQHRSNCVAE